jgi:hypothetical protein
MDTVFFAFSGFRSDGSLSERKASILQHQVTARETLRETRGDRRRGIAGGLSVFASFQAVGRRSTKDFFRQSF